MKRSNFLFLCGIIAATLYLNSCQNKKLQKNEFNRSSFKKAKTLKSSFLPTNGIQMPADICVIPSKNVIILVDIRSPNFLKAYQMTTGKFIRAFAKKGDGPFDQSSCQTIQYQRADNLVYSADFVKKKIFGYSVDQIISDTKDIKPIIQISIENKSVRHPLVLANKKIVDFKPNFMEKKIALFNMYDSSGKYLKSLDSYPKIKKNYPSDVINTAFIAGLNYSKDNRYVLVNYVFTDFLEIYDIEGKLIRRVQGPDQFDPEVKNMSYLGGTVTVPTTDAHNTYGGRAVMMNDDFYVLYDGSLTKLRNYHINTLFKFDKFLNPVRSYHLSQPIIAFDIDFETNTLYGFSHKIKNGLLKYNLQ